jgi:hypothetical protein
MNIICLNGHFFDLDQLVSAETRPASFLLTFKNNDTIELTWRDLSEQADIHRALQIPLLT